MLVLVHVVTIALVGVQVDVILLVCQHAPIRVLIHAQAHVIPDVTRNVLIHVQAHVIQDVTHPAIPHVQDANLRVHLHVEPHVILHVVNIALIRVLKHVMVHVMPIVTHRAFRIVVNRAKHNALQRVKTHVRTVALDALTHALIRVKYPVFLPIWFIPYDKCKKTT